MKVGRHTNENFYLKENFIAYLQSKNYALSTQVTYCFSVHKFLQWYNHDTLNCTKKDVLQYLEHLKQQSGLQNISRKSHLVGLNHYFTFLHQSGQVIQNPCSLLKIRGITKISLYNIFTAEELTQLYDNYYLLFIQNFDGCRIPLSTRKQSELSRERNAAILSILLNQGTTTNEIDTMLLQDIDLQKATVKIRGGKRSNGRTIPLKAEQIGLLMHYINVIRPQFLSNGEESEKLFLPYSTALNQKAMDKESMINLFKPLTKQLKSIEPRFLNFKQIRASVITLWLKMYGLRKTQYLAGHRYIRGTEYYLPNNLEELTNDISKHHPF